MIIRIVPNKPRRGLISITPDKKIFDFRSLGTLKHPLYESRRDAISTNRTDADNHKLKVETPRRVNFLAFSFYLLNLSRQPFSF